MVNIVHLSPFITSVTLFSLKIRKIYYPEHKSTIFIHSSAFKLALSLLISSFLNVKKCFINCKRFLIAVKDFISIWHIFEKSSSLLAYVTYLLVCSFLQFLLPADIRIKSYLRKL